MSIPRHLPTQEEPNADRPKTSGARVRPTLTLLVAAVFGFGLAVPAAVANHNVDGEANDDCASANGFPTDNWYHTGWLDGYPNDYKDFYKRWVSAGNDIHLQVYNANADLNLVLHTPGCVVAAFNYQSGNVGESITYRATTSGYWYEEVWHQVGSATSYSVRFDVTIPEPPPCVPTYADPYTINQFDNALTGQTYYVEERDAGYPVIPAAGFLLGQGTWVYEEANGLYDLQRGGTGATGDHFPPGGPSLLVGEDPINDETCGAGPDTLIVNLYAP